MSDNIDQQVKFKSTSQEVYDNLAEKDPNSLYFAEDSQKLYKGDIQFSNGLIDESNFIPIYELSEDEYWDKYNSGQLDLAGYNYESVCIGYNEIDENILWDLRGGGIIDTGDKYYVASYAEVVGGVLTEISKDLQSIKSFNLKEMLPHKDNAPAPLSFLRDCYQYNDLIGYDDDGYLYINVHNCDSVICLHDSYSSGILAIDTKDIDNSASWNIIESFDSSIEGIAFRPINFQKYLHCDEMYPTWTPLMYRDPMLKSKDGGVFGFEYVKPSSPDSGVNKQSNLHIPFPYNSVCYFKSGHLSVIGPEESAPIEGGCRCFTTNPDNDDNLYYISISYINGRQRLCVNAQSKDRASKTYCVDLDDSMTSFTSTCAANASFVRCKNNKVFMFIGNINPICAVLDLKSEEYSSIHKFTDFTFNAKKREQVISNIIETDASICFTVFNGQICQYVCWNFIEDKIYSRAATVHLYYSSKENACRCNILRLGYDNTLISSYIDLYGQELNIVTLSCKNLEPVRRYAVSNITREDNGLLGEPIYETSDNRMIVFASMFGSTTVKAISIDSNSHSTLLAGGQDASVSAGFSTTIILVPSSEPGLLIGFDIRRSYDRDPRCIIDINRGRFWGYPSRIGLHDSTSNTVILDNNTIINMSYIRKNDTVINPAFLMDVAPAMRSYIMGSSIKILSSGDITQ